MGRDTTMAAKHGWVSVPEGLGEPDNCPMDEVKIHNQGTILSLIGRGASQV